jgi:polyisoprenoid-binding protein YceI
MKLRFALASLVLALGLGTFAFAGGVHHEVDPAHAWGVFKISHLGISNCYGTFHSIAGSVDLDGDKGAVEISIKADSVDTGNEKRDQHLKGPDFFDAKQFPTIGFKSTKVEKTAEGWNVTGDLAFHGVTKPITAKVVKTGEGETPNQTGGKDHRVGFEATFTVKRSEFGMSYGVQMGMGDEVGFTLSLEAIKK